VFELAVSLHIPTKQGLRLINMRSHKKTLNQVSLHIPTKQGLRLGNKVSWITHFLPVSLHIPTKQGLRLIFLLRIMPLIVTVSLHIPTKQGLRLCFFKLVNSRFCCILTYSNKTRIKTFGCLPIRLFILSYPYIFQQNKD